MANKRTHGNAADEIKTVNGLKPHLCSLAYFRRELRPELCVECNAMCAYGEKLLILMGIDAQKDDRSQNIPKLFAQEKLQPLHYRLRKRKK